MQFRIVLGQIGFLNPATERRQDRLQMTGSECRRLGHQLTDTTRVVGRIVEQGNHMVVSRTAASGEADVILDAPELVILGRKHAAPGAEKRIETVVALA